MDSESRIDKRMKMVKKNEGTNKESTPAVQSQQREAAITCDAPQREEVMTNDGGNPDYGQQKNKYVLSAYSYAVNKYPKLRSIIHKYLLRGHSQNEGDNIHSVIEKQVSRHLRASPIYIPQQYMTLKAMAKKNGPPYNVRELTHDDFYDLKFLQEQWDSNFTVDMEQTQVNWNDIKTSYENSTYRRVNVRNRSKRKSYE